MSRKYNAEIDVILKSNENKILDSKLAKILVLIDKYGSILAASKALGIPYSRAWEYILKAENAIGKKIIKAKRGGKKGGGARLTSKGRELLDYYLRIYRRITHRELELREFKIVFPDIMYMGSHDPGVNRLSAILREKYNIIMEIQWLGSGKGIASLMIGDADIVGIHIYDRSTGSYNLPYITSFIYSQYVMVIRGYSRSIGFVTRRRVGLREILGDLLSGRLRLINRQKASGTRILLESILLDYLGVDKLSEEILFNIKGYYDEVKTHFEVAEKVASGEADVGICIEWAARQYVLEFIPVKWENFDFVIKREDCNNDNILKLIDALRSAEFKNYLNNLHGYRIPDNIGKIIYP